MSRYSPSGNCCVCPQRGSIVLDETFDSDPGWAVSECSFGPTWPPPTFAVSGGKLRTAGGMTGIYEKSMLLPVGATFVGAQTKIDWGTGLNEDQVIAGIGIRFPLAGDDPEGIVLEVGPDNFIFLPALFGTNPAPTLAYQITSGDCFGSSYSALRSHFMTKPTTLEVRMYNAGIDHPTLPTEFGLWDVCLFQNGIPLRSQLAGEPPGPELSVYVPKIAMTFSVYCYFRHSTHKTQAQYWPWVEPVVTWDHVTARVT